MTAPPREPDAWMVKWMTEAGTVMGVLAFSVDEARYHGQGAPIPLYAAPAPSAYTTGHCKENAKKGGCQLHNLHCGWPECDRRPAPAPPAAQPAEPHHPLCNFWNGDAATCDQCARLRRAEAAEPDALFARLRDMASELHTDAAANVQEGGSLTEAWTAGNVLLDAADLIERQAREIADLTRLQERNEGRIKAIVDDALLQRAERAESALAARDAALTLIMRNADAAKEPCGTDPESAAAIRNGKFASLAQIAAQVLGLVSGPDLTAAPAPDAPLNVVSILRAPSDLSKVLREIADAVDRGEVTDFHGG